MLRRAALLVPIVVLAAPAGAAGAQRFDGASRGGAPAVLQLTATHAAYDVRVRGRCSDRSRFASGLAGSGAEIGRQGAFAARALRVHDRYGGHLGLYDFWLIAQRRRDTVRGTVRVSFRSGALRCSSGRAPFVAHRDGSRGAPFRDARSATGRYHARGKGLGRVTVRVFLPARRVRGISFSWRVRCRRKAVLTGRESFGPLSLRGGRFGVAGSRAVGLGDGRTSREGFALRGRLVRVSGAYRVFGTWRLGSVIVRRGTLRNRCTTPGLRFSGRFAGR